MGELSDVQALILLVLLGAPEGGMDVEQLAVATEELTDCVGDREQGGLPHEK